ncbi:MAG TPA: hypothetical protein VM658_04500, partial [bacterium]|nr:hypothetical protein [bacterium]
FKRAGVRMFFAWRSRRPVRQAGWGQRSGAVLCRAAKKHHDLLGDPWRSWRLGGFLPAYFGQECVNPVNPVNPVRQSSFHELRVPPRGMNDCAK